MSAYTKYPRAILWLLQGGEVRIEGPDADAQPGFVARVASFYVSKLPITNVQFAAFRPGFSRCDASPDDDDAAVGISFEDAAAYCDWYASVSRKAMRLPTEVEWEYACRGGTTGRCPHRGDPKQPNPFGLYGMLGGVWEWTSSLHLPYPAVDGDGRDDPASPGARVLRGSVGCGVRRGEAPTYRADDVGFRIVRSLR